MTYAAYVAIQRGKNSYTVHYSDNGAYKNQLCEVLENKREALLNGSYQSLGRIDFSPELENLTEQHRNRDDVELRASDTAINPEPVVKNIPKKGIGFRLNFADIESLYVVEQGQPVKMYFPAWINPNVVDPLKDHVEIDVHRENTVLSNPTEMAGEVTTNPIQTIDADSLTGKTPLDDTITKRVMSEQHANIYALIAKSIDEFEYGDNDESDRGAQSEDSTHKEQIVPDTDMTSAIQTHSHDLVMRVSSDPTDWLPEVNGVGVFIELGNQTRREVELDVAEKRYKIGVELAALRREKTEKEFCLSQVELLIKLYEEYGNRVAMFSPPPYGTIVKLFQQIEVDMSIAENMARKIMEN